MGGRGPRRTPDCRRFYRHFTDIAAYRAAGVGFLHLAGAHPGTHAAEGRERFLDIMLKP